MKLFTSTVKYRFISKKRARKLRKMGMFTFINENGQWVWFGREYNAK